MTGKEEAYDIRSILGQMRDEYWQALSEEEVQAREVLECLVFTLGGERFAFETQHACEVIRVPKLIRVPAVQTLIAGIFNLRGEITAAMDIRPMLGLAQPEIGAAGRIVVVKSDRFATGILIEAAHGVQGLCCDGFEPAMAGGAKRFVRGHFNEQDGSIILLDMEALLAAPEIVVGEG
ncbi:scaffold protein CheW associated with MCPs of class 40H [Citrifermentans bemidjiense Bem]|uniref:Scaffold protein CheW associated with MCPs of class 40H n=1 Tax=Citrifermentans bemidjiense (strain ATCC BAA-1014 / DSM 16622 / JCM 12645 / Bem) TaxID=404380 RepID=B5EF83_CITBB|nr:chemotaxis protein CheW [Citrifermentans bemidjiense]ACH39392.1 scaffold protein CheW associated with MCPs of class 40H [Citrifermentans bemidjiense Bem]